MKYVNIDALRVFNAIKKLGITEKEFQDILEEQSHTERTGLSLKTDKKGYCIGVSHDENHTIVIQKIVKQGKIPKTPSRILFKTLITFEDLPEEVYTLHSIAQYRAMDTDIRHVAHNLDELKDRICDRFADGYPKELGEMINYGYDYDSAKKASKDHLKEELVNKQLQAIYWLFGETLIDSNVKSRDNVPKIIKAFQRNNRRVAIFHHSENYEVQRNCYMASGGYTDHIVKSTIMVKTYTPVDEQHNYVCPNREVYFGNGAEIWIDDDLLGKVTSKELEIFSERVEDWMLLTADRYNNQKSAVRRELMSAKREEKEKNVKKLFDKRLKEQFSKGSVVRNGITFTKKSLSYEGVELKGNRVGEFITSQDLILLNEPNFNDIYKSYVDFILDFTVHESWYSMKKTFEIRFTGIHRYSINNIKIVLEKRINAFYVNNRRISKDDLPDVLIRAISYGSQAEFNDFVIHTSRVNLKTQEAMRNGGLVFELIIDKTSDNDLIFPDKKMILSLPLHRERGKNYVLIDGKKLKVQNSKALFDLGKDINSSRISYSGGGYLQRTIKLLYKAIKGIDPKLIGKLIRNGQKEYRALTKRINEEEEIKIQKSEKFVSHAIKLTKAKKIKEGYLVKGESGSEYTINSETLAVYLKQGKEEKYLCIIDIDSDTDSKWGKNDFFG